MNTMMKKIQPMLFSLLTAGAGLAADPAGDLLTAMPDAVEAWKDMRFGMFICWGPVSLTGREIGWSRGKPTPIEEYDTLYKKWNPDKFDAREWAKVVKEAGARYVVFLLKHHDGFCLWDTTQTDYNVMNGPFKRNVAREFAAACREQGLGFFPYYSTCDWHHPDFPLTGPGGTVQRITSNLDRYTDYLEAQVKELIAGLHILRWPAETITLPAIKPRIVKHTVLTGGAATVRQTEARIEISVPADQRDAIDTIVKLELDASAKDIPAIKSQPNGAASLTTGKKATASNWFQERSK